MRAGKSIFFASLVLLVGVLLGVQIESVVSGDDTFRNLQKLEEVFSLVRKQYVEDRPSERLAADAIEGMLARMDPHSVYIPAEEIEQMNEDLSGSFGGIGLWFEIVRDTLNVTSTITDGPSEKVGLQAGDRIVAIDDSSAVGISSEGVKRRLKGPVGTTVSVTVERRGYREPLYFTITRDRIPIFTVDASYLMDGRTGYIRINRFAQTTYDEFSKALRDLEAKGMERLILDLRDNGGGIMEDAIQISDEFLRAGEMIVYTKSRHPDLNWRFRAENGGRFESQPLIVLVNENSASASEIVAGAIQDHDRGLIVGRRSFGKGLVQQQFPLSDGSALVMTVSRYYTPAGRLIQTDYEGEGREEYYRHKFEDLEKSAVDVSAYVESVPDSLKFKTDGGRIVFGGGGILPDYVIPPDTSSLVVQALIRSGADYLFVRDWLERQGPAFKNRWKDRRDAFAREFSVTPEMWSDFWAFARSHGIEVMERPPAARADTVRTVFARADVEADRFTIETRLRAYVARHLWGGTAWFPVIHEIDNTLLEAGRLWPAAEALAAKR